MLQFRVSLKNLFQTSKFSPGLAQKPTYLNILHLSNVMRLLRRLSQKHVGLIELKAPLVIFTFFHRFSIVMLTLGLTDHFIGGLQAPNHLATLTAEPLAVPKGFVNYTHYSFLEAVSVSYIERQDMQFLEQCGCFSIPTKPLLDELVQEYFMHVHAHLPLLKEDDFWAIYTNSEEAIPQKRRMSLFVLQAMLFVACSVRFYAYR